MQWLCGIMDIMDKTQRRRDAETQRDSRKILNFLCVFASLRLCVLSIFMSERKGHGEFIYVLCNGVQPVNND